MDEVLRQFGFGGIVDAVSKKGDARQKDLGWLDSLGEDDERTLERGRGGYIENEEAELKAGIEEFGGDDEDGIIIPDQHAAEDIDVES